MKTKLIDIPRMSQKEQQKKYPGIMTHTEFIRKRDFPLLDRADRVYLDSGATSQEPQSVKDKIHQYRSTHIRGSNHSENSAEAKEAQMQIENVRDNLQNFFGAYDYSVSLTSGTTASSIAVASRFNFHKNDILLLSESEHNSQILSPRNFAGEAGAKVLYIPVDSEGRLDLDFVRNLVAKNPDGYILLFLAHASNVTGIVHPVQEIRQILRDSDFIYLDMAQSAGHIPISLDDLGVDFAGVSAHKMYGPFGTGALFVHPSAERRLGDRVSGGSAVHWVSKGNESMMDLPERLEPGTQNIEGAIEWGYALDYLKHIGMAKIEAHDRELGRYFVGELEKINSTKGPVHIYGPKTFEDRIAVVTFNIGREDSKNFALVAQKLDQMDISVRDGCFCAHILMAKLVANGYFEEDEKPGAVRASFSFYNDLNDAYKAVKAIDDLVGLYLEGRLKKSGGCNC